MTRDGDAATLVVIGQGYVGLPLAKAAVESGLRVWGFDVDETRVSVLNSGRSHVDDIHDSEIMMMRQQGYEATGDASVISKAGVVVICVPTPLDSAGGPDLHYVHEASSTVAEHLTPGTTVVLESTTYPGTTEDEVLPIIERESGLRHGVDFFLAFSPERIDPGSEKWGIRNTPKLVGGIGSQATEHAIRFYENFVDTVIPLSGAREAEAAKLLENTYRHANIALVNEMARFCHELNIDIWEVIRGAATKPFGFQRFTPGPGVGGHCIPIDPSYMSFQVKKTLGYQFRFVELAQEINNSMPSYVVERVMDLLNESGKPLNGSSVLLLGVTYKPDIADQRESPALPIGRILVKKRANLRFHDPKVSTWHIGSDSLECEPDLDKAIKEADVTVLLQNHTAYDVDGLARKAELFFDTRGALSSQLEGAYKL